MVDLLWTIDIAELHIQRVLGEERARSQRYVDVWWMSEWTWNSDELTISIILEDNVPAEMDDFVRSTFDVNKTSTFGESAFHSQHYVTMEKWITVCRLFTFQLLRLWRLTPVEGFTKLFVVACMNEFPNWLSQQVNLKVIYIKHVRIFMHYEECK